MNDLWLPASQAKIVLAKLADTTWAWNETVAAVNLWQFLTFCIQREAINNAVNGTAREEAVAAGT